MSTATPPTVQSMGINVTKTKKPAVWETGGGGTNTGNATIIAGPCGEKKRPYFVETNGHLSCQRHALVPIEVGSWVILIGYWNKARNEDGYDIEVYRITEIDLNEETATRVLIAKWNGRGWNTDELPAYFPSNAVDVARAKAVEYHCREPRYILPRS